MLISKRWFNYCHNKKIDNNGNKNGSIAGLHVPCNPQGSEDQSLVIYCDEIKSLAGSSTSSGVSVEFTGGKLNLFGRKLYSKDLYGFICGGSIQNGLVRCIEIISENSSALVLNQFNEEISIISNFIEASRSDDGGVIFSFEEANFVIKMHCSKYKFFKFSKRFWSF